MRRAAVLFLFFFLGTSFLWFGSGFTREPVLTPLLKRASDALDKNDKKRADFHIARYLGLRSLGMVSSAGSEEALEQILAKRRLPPKAFVSGEWDKDFIDWFEKGPYRLWGVDEKKTHEKGRFFELTTATDQGRYFATVTASPEIQSWHVVRDGLLGRRLILVMGSASDKPSLFFGKILQGRYSSQFSTLFLKIGRRSLHHVWKPVFFDLDKDGVPELWLRYSLSWGNGFSQVLEIYRIQGDSRLELMRRFQTQEEGIARMLPDGRVELGTASGSQKDFARFKYDRYRFETFEYRRGTFEKVSEENRPFFPSTPDWRPYFLEPSGEL